MIGEYYLPREYCRIYGDVSLEHVMVTGSARVDRIERRNGRMLDLVIAESLSSKSEQSNNFVTKRDI